jgi:hypothetical protein
MCNYGFSNQNPMPSAKCDACKSWFSQNCHKYTLTNCTYFDSHCHITLMFTCNCSYWNVKWHLSFTFHVVIQFMPYIPWFRCVLYNSHLNHATHVRGDAVAHYFVSAPWEWDSKLTPGVGTTFFTLLTLGKDIRLWVVIFWEWSARLLGHYAERDLSLYHHLSFHSYLQLQK